MPSEMSLLPSKAPSKSCRRGQPQIGPIFSARPLWPWFSPPVAWHCICEEEKSQYQTGDKGVAISRSVTKMKRQEVATDLTLAGHAFTAQK